MNYVHLTSTWAAKLITLLLIFPAHATAQEPSGVRPTNVIVDSSDSRSVRGNASIALAWGRGMKKPYKEFRGAVVNLVRAMNEWTDVYTTGYSQLGLTSNGVPELPFVVIVSEESFDLTPAERDGIASCMNNGGLIFCENTLGTSRSSPVEQSFRKLIDDLYGDSVDFRIIPDSHPLFHSFFDFEEGPPKVTTGPVVNNLPLLGVWKGEHLIAVYSDIGYTVKWSEPSGNILQLKMGVNMIIFALTRPDVSDTTQPAH